MATTLNFQNGEPDFGWLNLLLQVLNDGAYVEVDDTGYGQVSLQVGDIVLLIDSATNDITLSDSAMTAGTITGVTLMDGIDSVFTATFDHFLSYLAVQTLADNNDMNESDLLSGLLVWYGSESVTATGSDAGDAIYGGAVDDSLSGGDGRDTLVGGDAADYLNGGGDWDDIRYGREVGTQGVIVNLGIADVEVDIGSGMVTVAGGMAKDTFGNLDTVLNVEFFSGTQFADYFQSSTDDDGAVHYFMGGDGADTFSGGNGHDGVAYDLVEVESGGGGVIVNLSNQNFDTGGGQTIDAGTARDTFGNIDTLDQTEGAIEGANGSAQGDTLIGGDGYNRLEGNGGDDELYGGDGNSNLFGGDGSDYIEGGNNDDWMVGGQGNDYFRGQDGWNNISYIDEDGTDRVVFDWNTGTAQDTYGNDDAFDVWSIDSVHGSNDLDGDVLIGNAEENTFHGYDGDDLIVGGGGRDTVHFHGEQFNGGGAGVTIVLGEDDAGNDLLADEAPSISVFGTLYFLDELVDGSVKGYAIDGYGKTDTLYSIENAEGTDFNDSISGSNERNELRGGDGNDTINGRGGDDNISGGRGDDEINAGDGEDFIEGDGGADTVNGGIGKDILGFYRADGSGDYDLDGVYIELNANGDGTGTADGSIFRDGGNVIVDTEFENIDVIEGTRGNDTLSALAGFHTDGLGWDWRTFNDDRDPGGPFQWVGGAGDDSVSDASGAVVMAYSWEYNMEDDHGTHGVAINLSDGDKTAVGLDTDDDTFDDTIVSGNAIDTFGDTDTLSGVVLFDLTRANDYFWGRNNGGDTGVYVQGNDGNDFIVGGMSRDSVNGDNDNDTVMGGAGIDQVDGGDGDDLLYGDDESDSHALDDGGDQMGGGQGNDTMYGGAGRDNMNGDDGDDDLFGGAGNDRLNGQNGIDELFGEDGNDQIEGNDGEDLLNGGAGDDELRGGNDGDTLIGDAGNDDLEGQDGDDALYGDNFASSASIVGNDELRGGQGNDTLHGGYGSDRLEGDDDNDSLLGGFGDDELRGGNQNDTLLGEAGDDRLFGQNDNDNLDGGAGNDKLWGDDGNDVLQGGAGTDDLNGGEDNDTLFASAGNDRLFADDGNDTYELGGLSFAELWDSDGIDLIKTSIDRVMHDVSGLDTIENATITVATNGIDLEGNDNANVLTGGGGTNSLTGGEGNDTLLGAAGNDTLVGGNGLDSLDGGANNDSMIGGASNDTYVVDAAGDVADETGGNGTDLVKSSVTFNLGAVAQAKGTVENLTLTGGAAINGTGGTGINTIIGNTGINTLNGKGGNDVLTGGASNDIFVFDTAPNAATNRDVITDLNESGNDTIHLQNSAGLFTALAAGALAAAAYTENATGAATAAAHRIIYEIDTGKLFYDSNGNAAGGSVHFATLDANKAAVYSNADFFII